MFKVSLYNGYNTNSITDYKRLNPEHRVSFIPFSKIDFDVFLSIQNKDDEIFFEKMDLNKENNSYYIDLNFTKYNESDIFICFIKTKHTILESFLFKICADYEYVEETDIVRKIEEQINKVNNDIKDIKNIVNNISKYTKKTKTTTLINSSNTMSIKESIKQMKE